jgi:hypothetical protein
MKAYRIALLMVIGLNARAGEIVITVKGTLAGEDYLGIFGKEKALSKGTPFTLVYTFDDARGEPQKTRCPNAASGITGTGFKSPGIAIITIGTASYTFGRKENVRSSIWRSVPSACDAGEMDFDISEGKPPATSRVHINIKSAARPLTTDADWRSPLSLTKFTAPPDGNMFTITRGGTYGLMTRAFLTLDSVTISSPEGEGR